MTLAASANAYASWLGGTVQTAGINACTARIAVKALLNPWVHVCAEAKSQRSAAEVRRELESRGEARNNVKLIWRALAALTSGCVLSSSYTACTAHR